VVVIYDAEQVTGTNRRDTEAQRRKDREEIECEKDRFSSLLLVTDFSVFSVSLCLCG
jgi:hypothetical protein